MGYVHWNLYLWSFTPVPHWYSGQTETMRVWRMLWSYLRRESPPPGELPIAPE